MGFTGVINAHGPSLQPKANSYPTYILTTTTGSNQRYLITRLAIPATAWHFSLHGCRVVFSSKSSKEPVLPIK